MAAVFFSGNGNKRIVSLTPQDDDPDQRDEKRRALEKIFYNTNEYFGVRYWIDEERRWMLPSEEHKYLYTAHYSSIQYPVLYSFSFDDPEHLCVHCGKRGPEHEKMWLNVGDCWMEQSRICGSVDKPLYGRIHYNKYSRLRIGDVHIMSMDEYYVSEKQTQ